MNHHFTLGSPPAGVLDFPHQPQSRDPESLPAAGYESRPEIELTGKRTLSRRAMFAGIGALASTAALAVPAAAADPEVRKVFVKVASPSFSVPPEVMAAIKNWQRANAVKKVALDRYNRSSVAALAAGGHHTLPIDHPIRSAWIDADSAATQAQFDLLDLLESYAISGGVA